MNGILTSGAADQTLLWALNVAVHATILTTLALLIASFLRRRAAIRYWVLCFGLMLVLASPGISMLIQSSGRGWLTMHAAAPTASPSLRSPQTQEVPASYVDSPGAALNQVVPPTPSPLADADRDAEIASLDNPPAASAPIIEAAMPTGPAPVNQMTASQPHRLVEFLRYGVLPIAAVWAIGSIFLLTRMLFGWSRMVRILRAATPVRDPQLLAAFAGIYRSTSGVAARQRVPLLVISDRVSGPVAAGVFHGRVVLPISLVQQVDASELEDVLIHEVAHIVRHDQIVVLLQNLIAALYWPHPLVRALNRELAKAREEVCDNFVLAATDAPAYSRTLLSLAHLVQRHEAIPGSVGFFTSKWKLEERVAGLLDAGRDRSTLPSRRHWLLIAAAAIGLAAVTSVATLTIATASEENGPSEQVEPTELHGSVSGPDGIPVVAPVENLSGLITDSSGSAVADAMVAVIASKRRQDASELTTPLAQATTDSDGRFALKVPAVSNEEYYGVSLIARKDDSAIAFESLSLGGLPESVTLRLKKAEPIRIRLVDLEGQPASDMPVLWRSLAMRAENGDTTRGARLINLSPRPSAAPPPLRTDAAGWLTVPHVAADQGVYLDIAGDQRFAPQSWAINTGLPEKRPERDATYRFLVKNIPPGESATIPLAPAQPFSGQVLLGETDKPAANTRITIWSSQQQFAGSMYTKEGRTDGEGRFRLNPFPGVRYGIQVYPPKDTPYQPVQLQDLRWDSSERTSNMIIRLPEGLVVRGSVIDEQTRRPIEDAYVQYIADANNPNDTDDFIDGWQTMEQTDAEGRFSVPALPAGGTIVVHAGKNQPYAVHMVGSRQMRSGLPGGARNYAHAFLHVDLDDASSKAREDVTIALSPSIPISVRLQDSKGRPVEGATYTTPLVKYPSSLTYRAFPEAIVGSELTLHGLKAGDRHQIHFWHSERRIGATAELTADNRALLVTLQPAGSATMRLIDTQGHPIAERPVSLQMLVTKGHSWAVSVGLPNAFTPDRDFQSNFDRELNDVPVITGDNGEVTLESLIPGVTYEFDYWINGEEASASIAVSPGQRLDVGDVMIDPPEES